MAYYLVRNLIAPGREVLSQPLGLVMHGAVVILLSALALTLWGQCTISMRVLRGLELVLFGSVAVFFGCWQYLGFVEGLPFGVKCALADQDLVRAAGMASTTRWFFLILVYGVFIPNTWLRCATMTGIAAVMPLVLTPVAAAVHGHLGSGIWQALPDMAVLLGTGVAVALFACYRLQILEEKAFEAKQLGQYRLKRRLGAGGMGDVYLAEHLLLRRPCAVKLIRPEYAGDRTNLERFEREVQSMAALTNWNTVEVFDYGRAEDGTFYYVMEYLPGRNLEQLVSLYGPLPPARAIHFLRQICRALREAHGVGLLHRDIKPSNVLACERGKVWDVAKLVDFGLVQETRMKHHAADNRLTVQGTILGSPPFMSPEQAAGKAFLDPRSDIYSLGGVAYYLLTRQPPFDRDTALEMLIAHASEPVVPPSRLRPDLPSDLEAVVLRCLEKEPDKRFPDANSLEKALAACSDADQWTEEDAQQWWVDHRDVPATEPELDSEPTRLAVEQ
jgi:serine/threonine-protein kinase